MASTVRLTRIWLLLVALSSAPLFAAATQTKPVKWVRGIYVAETPSPQLIASDQLWSHAEARAKTLRGITLRGQGRSMLPLYKPGTVLVIAPIKFADLRRGQTVVYYNSEHRQVAHVLVAKCDDGWRVAGLNNRLHDDEGVTAQNLFGVVAEAYQPLPAGTSVASLN
ncbi:S24 family peptidase [Actomonas aquatica]|uniref:S24 family peptidase n=1 Tax=Actomonas aquatica TaxID=2866162 RepID=A0ABZ1CBQ0_9BACT|nr:S24 family peptidase [Opitutus sp. WL0086]WRQ89080.1 S24 family peptidase [Opitutus sp. WL0086]